MKLLLTSSGLANESLRAALKNMTKEPIKIAFIPTAANVVEEEKSWLINDLNNCQKVGTVDIVDISALPKNVWLQRLEKANVIVFGGGDSEYLMKCIISSGLKKEIHRLLKTRIYVGISAGSSVAGKTLEANHRFIFSTKKAPLALGLVNFNVRSHFNSPKFPKFNDENLKKLDGKFDGDIYALDDESGILIYGNKIKVISEGNWKIYKGKSV